MPYAPLASVSLADIDRSITDAPPAEEKERLDRAAKALEFYSGDFSRYPTRVAEKNGDRTPRRYERTATVMQQAVNTLTKALYKDGPKRTLPDHEAASEWLNNVYRRNTADALFQQADRYTGISDVAAFQAVPTEDPARPVRLLLWDASQFTVWLDPNDQTTPAAVAVRDKYDGRRRIRLWTVDTYSVYLTDQYDRGKTAGATAYKFQSRVDNEFGILPFAFAHWNMPVCDFWSGGPGDHLVLVNDCVNFGLTNGFDRVRYNLNPIVKLRNVRPDWRPPAPVSPGDMWNLPGTLDASGEGAGDPDAEYLQSDSSFVVAGWDDLDRYIDTAMQMHGIPPSIFRATQESVRSGVSIVNEQIPVIEWAQGRKRPFAAYEDSLCRVVLAVGARHLGVQDDSQHQATAAQLEEAAAEPGLQLRWPKMFPDVPGVEQDQSDQWLLDNRLTSKTMVLMRREGYTREEAEMALEEIAEDLKREQALFADVQQAEAESALFVSGKQHPDATDADAADPADPNRKPNPKSDTEPGDNADEQA